MLELTSRHQIDNSLFCRKFIGMIFDFSEPEKPRSLVWRLGSGLYNTTTGVVTGTVGAGVTGVKWVAGKGYNATTATAGVVVTGTKAVVSKVPVPTWKKKDKKE